MSTRLKFTDSIVLNADEIVALQSLANFTEIYTTGSDFDEGNPQNYFMLNVGSGEGPALKAAIEKALTSAPSGRVIKVPASSDYTIASFDFVTDF